MRHLAALTLVLTLSLAPAALRPGGVTVNNGVSVNGNTCDQLLWDDASGSQREADIVQLSGNPGGNTGGYITRVTYNNSGTVTCNESGYSVDGTLSGLGQMVNHGGTGNGWVCTNTDGIKTGATTQVLFQGANHAIYQVDMDEYGDDGNHAKGTWHDRWIYFVANGRDDIVESLSYDFSSQAAGYWGYAGINSQVGHDSRSPYCSFNWTGTGAANTFSEAIDGVEYAVADPSGNPYKFQTVGSSPFSAGYTFNTAAANVPYTLQWKNSPDREIGYVSTFDLTQFAAGGGFTAASGDGLNIGSTGSTMPQSWGINYQSNGFQAWMGDKMTWQIPFGAAGGATGGTTFPDWTYAKNWTGYPTMGYTILIHLGSHSSAGVHAQVAEQAAIHALPSTALTAAVGTVVTSGKMNLQDSVGGFTFKPQGFNHMYNAWEVTCAGNAADVTLALGAASLAHPTFLFDGFSATLCQLTLNGTAQAEGTDMFSSLDSVNHRLYVTFNKALTGSEHIVISSACGSPTPTRTATPTPTLGGPTNTPAATNTPVSGGSGKSYCITVDYGAVPALLNYRKLTLNVSVGACSSVTATEDGSAIGATYNSGTGIATVTVNSALSLSSVIVTAVGWTSGGTGAVTKSPLYGNYHFAVSQTFDDGLIMPFTNAKPILDAHGWRAGCALVGSVLDGGYTNYMSWAQVQSLRAAGWDMYNHTYDHPTVTCANFATEFTQNQADFLTRLPGYNVTHIVYPYETTSADLCTGFPPGFLISGEAATGAAENFVDAALPNIYTIERNGEYGMDPTSWEAQVAATASNSRPGWNIFISHDVAPGSTDPATLTDGLGPYSTNVTALTSFYTWLDSTYGASGSGTLWFAPAGEVSDYLMTRDNTVINSSLCGTATPTPTHCAACSATPTFTNSPTVTMTYTPTPLPACSGNLIDDFEHGTANGFGGYWYTFATAPSTMSPSTWATTSPGYGGTGSCARAYGTMVTNDALGLGTGLASTGTNASAFSGISFWFKGDGNSYRFQIHSLVEGAAYNDFKYDFTPPTGWSFVNIPWASFAFPGWGTAYSLDTTQLSGMSWVPMTAGAYDFSVDNVIFNCPVPTPTSSPTVAAGTATATRTPSPSPTATPSPSPSPSATSTATASSTGTVSATASRTATGTPSRTASLTASPSATPAATGTPSATPSASPSATESFTDVPPGSTLTDTPTFSATWSQSPSTTVTPSATPSLSPVATATPSVTLPDSPTVSASPTVTASPSVSASPVPGSPTVTSTSTALPTALPSVSVTPTYSSTSVPAASATPMPTATATPTTGTGPAPASATPSPTGSPAAAGQGPGPLQVLGLSPYPNPNPSAVAVHLAGDADRVELRIYSKAEVRVLSAEGGASSAGWAKVQLPVGWQHGLPNGVYYVRVVAYRGVAVSGPVKPGKLVLIN